MAMQVESPPTTGAKEPSHEASSALQVNAKRASWSPSGSADQELLSPVSKLQLARKMAAEEQQQRIDSACLRMVEAKKQKNVKQVKKDVYVETTTTTTLVGNGEVEEEAGEGVIRSIARRVSSVFKTSTITEGAPEEKYSPTRELLRATRDRLQALVYSKKVETAEDGDAEGMLPSTNYHLKQLGFTNGKINIYASEAEQQSELRRHRKSALLCREKFLQDKTALDDGYDSAEDSDFHAEDDDDENEDNRSESVDNDDEDDEDGEEAEEVDMDPDEVEQLLRDRDQFLGIKPRRASKKARRWSVGIRIFLLSFIVLLIALVFAADQAQQRLGWCTGSVRTSFLCTSLLQTQQASHSLLSELQRLWPL